MNIHLPLTVYRQVKDDPNFIELFTRLESKIGGNNITDYIWDNLKGKITTQEINNFTNVTRSLCVTEEQRILFDLHNLHEDDIAVYLDTNVNSDHKETFNFDKQKMDELWNRIQNLPNTDGKIDCIVYFLQIVSVPHIIQGGKYFNEDMANIRQQIVDAYESSPTKKFDEETYRTYFLNKIDLFFINNNLNGVEKNLSVIVGEFAKYKTYVNQLYAEIRNKIPSDYHKQQTLKTVRAAYSLFYSIMMDNCNLSNEDFKKMDTLICQSYDVFQKQFKYSKFDWTTLKLNWYRFSHYFGRGMEKEFQECLDKIYDMINDGLKDRTIMLKSLNYAADFDQLKFLCFVSALIKMEEVLCTKYVRSKKFCELEFTQDEKDSMVDTKYGNPSHPDAVDWRFVDSKVNG